MGVWGHVWVGDGVGAAVGVRKAVGAEVISGVVQVYEPTGMEQDDEASMYMVYV